MEAACEAAGPRHILVNNVAVQPEAPCHEHSLEARPVIPYSLFGPHCVITQDWMRALNVNLTSYFLFSKYTIPHMLEQATPTYHYPYP